MKKKKINSILKNKNAVTIIASVLIVLVLVVGYNFRVNNAVFMETVIFAKESIPPKTEITDGMIDKMRIPREALKGNVIVSKEQIIDPTGKTKYYTRVNTMIPQGSLIYQEQVSKEEHLPDSSLYLLAKDEILNYITVDLVSSYSNSIKPGQYIDIYASLQYNSRNQVARLFKNIKILAVKTSGGQNVFENPEENRQPFAVYFGLPKEEDMFLKKIHTINSLGGGTIEDSNVSISQIVLTPIPTGAKDFDESEKLEVKITSDILRDIVDELVEDITESKTGTDTGGEVIT